MLAALLFALASGQAWAAASAPSLSLSSDFTVASDPLTTEKIWIIDPDGKNPHRRRWVLKRELNLSGLDTVKRPDGKFGVEATGIVSRIQGYVRPSGPWYQEISKFPCSEAPAPGFATPDGARVALEAAARDWERIVSEEKLKLGYLLQRITASTAALATSRALAVFQAWQRVVDEDWRDKVEKQARDSEWKSYAEAARKAGVCHGSLKAKASSASNPQWEKMMEPPAAEAPPPKLLARAPARRWNGAFSIRVGVKIADQTLVGRFLIDSSAPVSIIDPNFLDSQGIPVAWVLIPGIAPRKTSWIGGQALARPVAVDRLEVGGMPVNQRELLMMETSLFEPPSEVSTCCDGVLGADFLKDFVVEFFPGLPPAVNVWARDGFALPAGTPWIEVAQDRRGQLVSTSCEAAAGARRQAGVRWSLAQLAPLVVAADRGGSEDLRCGPIQVAQGIPASAGELSDSIVDASVGIPVLARGKFVLDLPHGRLWFPEPEKEFHRKIPVNRSGLRTEFSYRKGDRILTVKSIASKSPAAALLRQGLKVGQEIIRIDTKDAEEMDQWEVDQRLSGAYGDAVALEWMATPKSAKMAELRLGSQGK